MDVELPKTKPQKQGKKADNKNRRYPILPKIWTNPKGLKGYIRAYQNNILNVIPEACLTKRHAEFHTRFGSTYYISDPELIREIFKTDIQNFPKSKVLNMAIAPLIPNSIFLTKGKQWRRQHEIMMPVFTPRNLDAFEPIIADYMDKFLAETDLTTLNNQDITVFIRDLTFKIISLVIMGDENNAHFAQLHDFYEHYSEFANKARIYDIAFMKIPYFPNLRLLFHAKYVRRARKFGVELVQARLNQDPPQQPDFLEILIDAYNLRNKPTKHGIAEVRDNLNTFLVAGHETTAMTLIWALYALGFYPMVQKRVGAEAKNPINERPFADSHIKETLRMFPAAAILGRRAIKSVDLGGLSIKRSSGVIVPVIALHRHRDLWERPDEFDPRRFMNFKPKPMTYLPFGAGPRVCVAASFAMMEAKTILCKIMDQYRLTPNSHQPEPQQVLTLRSKNGVQMIFRKRD